VTGLFAALGGLITAVAQWWANRKDAAPVPEPAPPVEPGFAAVDAATDAEIARQKAAASK
jgi:hypothetical protein